MKICMVSGTFPNMRCGVGDYTYWLSLELKRLGIELDIITSHDSRVIKDENFDVAPIIKKWNFSNIPLLLRSIKAKKPDLVHLQYPTQAYKDRVAINIFPIIFTLAVSRIPLIVTIHDVKTANLLNKLRMITFLLCARKIILTAEEERRYLLKIFPNLSSKLEVIHIGANIKTFPFSQAERGRIRSGLGVKEEEILITHFGYILKKKRLEMIFYALRRLLDEGYKIRLAMISAFDPERNSYHARLKGITDRLNLEREIIWTGYCDQEKVSEYLSSSDISLQVYQDGVSFRRGSFMTPLAHGLPIVTTRVEGLPDGLKDHHNIIAVPVGDIKGLADGMKELIASAELRKRIGENAKIFSQRFSWRDIAQRHVELYTRLI